MRQVLSPVSRMPCVGCPTGCGRFANPRAGVAQVPPDLITTNSNPNAISVLLATCRP
jgi:hypothetical protein